MRIIDSQEVFSGRVFRVRVERVEIDGRERHIDVVAHPGSFAILARPQADSLVLVRQYRHAAARELWEIPAGTAEPGESPEEGARRELREETGYRAGSIRPIFGGFATPGYCEETLTVFLADDLVAGEQNLDADEDITVRTVGLREALRMQAAGEIYDLKTLAAIFWLAAGGD